MATMGLMLVNTFLCSREGIRVLNARPPSSMRPALQVALLAGAALACAGCSQADASLAPAARAQEPFPPSGEPITGVQRWLLRNSRLPAASYVSVGDRYAVALVSTDYGGAEWIRAARIRIEVVSEDF